MKDIRAKYVMVYWAFGYGRIGKGFIKIWALEYNHGIAGLEKLAKYCTEDSVIVEVKDTSKLTDQEKEKVIKAIGKMRSLKKEYENMFIGVHFRKFLRDQGIWDPEQEDDFIKDDCVKCEIGISVHDSSEHNSVVIYPLIYYDDLGDDNPIKLIHEFINVNIEEEFPDENKANIVEAVHNIQKGYPNSELHQYLKSYLEAHNIVIN